MNYNDFINYKRQQGSDCGFKPIFIPDYLFDFQKSLTEWAINKGRGAIFSDCGTGKTVMELVWAENIARKTNKNVLILSPLAVSWQTKREADKFGIECKVSRDGKINSKITITNYEQLHKFNSDDFAGIVCDESGILKSFKGAMRKEITIFMRKIQYRLLATATPAPNDYIELGTSSEALGYLGAMDMMNRFFKNDQSNSKIGRYRGEVVKWRLKGHAELPFWRWICSWARACRKPSDLGFNDNGFILPELIVNQTVVKANSLPHGKLFSMPAISLQEQREERRRTIEERCGKVAQLIKQYDCSLIWCHLNDEGDLLEKIIPNAIQVSGKNTEEWKEKAIRWFAGEYCICNDNLFRAKLTTWEKQEKNTFENITENIENKDSARQGYTNKNTKKNTRNICPNTIMPIEKNGNLQQNNLLNAIANEEKHMQKIQKLEDVKSKKLNDTDCDIQTHDLKEYSKNIASALNYTTNCTQKAVQFAEIAPVETAVDIESISITAIKQENSEDCFVHNAISVLVNSETIQKNSKERQCICGHENGIRRLISKPVIFGYGLNLQHCNHMTFFPSHSFEQYFQGVRRCWRFGQKNPVTVDIITTEGESRVMNNLQRKSEQADKMFERLITEMNNALNISENKQFNKKEEIPTWL